MVGLLLEQCICEAIIKTISLTLVFKHKIYQWFQAWLHYLLSCPQKRLHIHEADNACYFLLQLHWCFETSAPFTVPVYVERIQSREKNKTVMKMYIFHSISYVSYICKCQLFCLFWWKDRTDCLSSRSYTWTYTKKTYS